MPPDPLSYNMSDVNPHLTRCEPPPYLKAGSAPGIDYILMGSWKGRENQCIQLVMVLNCKLPTNGKQLPAFPGQVRIQTPNSEVSVLPLLTHKKWA